MNLRLASGVLLSLAVSLLSPSATAAQFPEPGRVIKIVVPYSSGGPADKTARDLAEAMAPVLGVPIEVENMAGASGAVGATKVINGAPNGYTLLFSHIGMSTAYALFRKSSDTLDDFEYIGVTSELPMILIARPNLDVGSVKELIQRVKRKQTFSIANAGTGSASQMCSLLVQEHLGMRMRSIAYKGTAPAMSDLLEGHIDLLCDQSSTAGPQVLAGRAKPLGVTTSTRIGAGTPLANVPTLDEAGLKGFSLSVWQGLYAPKGTPEHVIKTLNGALQVALRDPAFMSRQKADGASIVRDEKSTPAGHRNLVGSETSKWSEVIRKANALSE